MHRENFDIILKRNIWFDDTEMLNEKYKQINHVSIDMKNSISHLELSNTL